MRLVGVREASHAGHDTEYVVVERVDVEGRGVGEVDRWECRGGADVCCTERTAEGELEGGVINTGEVACAGRLVFFGCEREGVYVNTIWRCVGEALVRLDVVEVVAITDVEAIVAVELE